MFSEHLSQAPSYPGNEARVLLIDANHSCYGRDLIQNDPYLRGNTIRMISHGSEADACMMKQYFNQYRRVYADRRGEVRSRETTLFP